MVTITLKPRIVLEYLAFGTYELIYSPVTRHGMMNSLPGQDQDGYGKKITTDKMVQFNGQKTKYRVYATCYSNAASHWIICKGKKLWLRD